MKKIKERVVVPKNQFFYWAMSKVFPDGSPLGEAADYPKANNGAFGPRSKQHPI